MNQLYYGDNLDVLPSRIRDQSVDLIYLDPPFNSNQEYNLLFRHQDGTRAAAQVRVFEDTWEWNEESATTYADLVSEGGRVGEVLQLARMVVGESNMLAYLSMMAPRLQELHRVLKPTGSLYLHCDPTASHYLKMLLDAVFGPTRFRSEVVWKRSSAHNDGKQGRRDYGHIHDVLLFYTKSDSWTWNPQYTAYDESYVAQDYRHVADDGRNYKETDLTAARPGGDTEYDWCVKRKQGGRWIADLTNEHENPVPDWEYLAVRPYVGRYWAYSRDNMIKFATEGKLIHRRTGMPRLVQYSEDMPGVSLQDLWTDIPPLAPGAAERLGYPTQKPEALLERIINVSSNPGDVVLDPFCGCGTAVAAAQKLDRAWLGIDITCVATNLIKSRLHDSFGLVEGIDYVTDGEPTSIDEALQLAKDDPYQFQFWITGKVAARGTEDKKGADKGIDGRLTFLDGATNKARHVLISVKSGKTGVAHVRDLRGVIEREGAPIGVLITLQRPTRDMLAEAGAAGSYESPWGKHARIQLLTIEELLDGRRIDYPRSSGSNVTFRKAPRYRRKKDEQLELAGTPERAKPREASAPLKKAAKTTRKKR